MSKQCSKCKKIFDDSLTVCPDCGMGLISVNEVEKEEQADAAPVEQESRQVSVFSLTNEESANRIIEYMKEQGIEGNYQYSLREKIYKIYVSETDRKVALRACTSFYAVEAQRIKAEEDKRRAEEEAIRKAEEEARLKAEEEARRIAEEEERKKKNAEEEARRQQEEAIRLAEEEAKAKAEAAEKLKAEVEARVKAEEEAKIKAAQEAKIKAEEEARAKALEVEKLKAQAEEAKRKAEEAKIRIELEAKKRAEDERLKAAEEAKKRLKEEEEKKRLASEQRRSSFLNAIKENEEGKGTSQQKSNKSDFYAQFEIPHVTGETVQDEDIAKKVVVSDIIPENGPIFVETEPVDEYEVGDTIIVDAIEVDSSDDDFYSSINDSSSSSDKEIKSEFSDFISNVKKNKTTSFFGGMSNDTDNSAADSEADDEDDVIYDNSYDSKEPVVEDMFADNLFNKTEPPVAEPKNEMIEEVINDDLKKTGANKFASVFEENEKKANNTSNSSSGPVIFKPGTAAELKRDFKKQFSKFDNIDDIDNGTYRGFVPDYSQSKDADADAELAKKYGFDADAYKALKEQTAKRAQERKNNPIEKTPKPNKDFKIIDDEKELADIKGFVPDYSAKEAEKKMAFYGHTTIDYSKYRTKNAEDLSNDVLHELTGTLRSANKMELGKLFDYESVKNSSKPKDYDGIKSSTYLLALTGTQLNSLFSSWLMTNCTKTTTKIFYKPNASKEDNKKAAVDGIKSMLMTEFGKLDDSIIDVIVTRYYERFIEE